MKLTKLIILAWIFVFQDNYALDQAKSLEASRTTVRQFAAEMQAELKEALQAGGPVNAIKVCKQIAPAIAKRLSADTGWNIRRTSLKTRNPANQPDSWEGGVLERFEKRRENGNDVKNMETLKIVQNGNMEHFRYMKAIPTAIVCLTYKAKGGAYTRKHFFGKYTELLELVDNLSDDDLWRLNRGGHDPHKVYAAYAAAMAHQGQPTVILAKTVKGYGMGSAGEGRNTTHQQKKMDIGVGIPDQSCHRFHGKVATQSNESCHPVVMMF